MEWGGDVNVPSATFPRLCTRCWCYAHIGWGAWTTFPRPCKRCWCYAHMGWGGVGWGGDVYVPSTTFPRPSTRCWCYAHMGWGGVGMLTFLRPRSLDLAQDADATLALGGVGWSGGCLRSFDHVPLTLHKMLMLRSHRVGWSGVGMLTFLRPRSLDLAQDADARLTWGRVGWGCLRSFDHVPLTLHKMLMLRSHGVGWGRVGWGCLRSFDHVPSTLHKMLMLRTHWVGWGGGVGMFTFLWPRSLDLAQDADATLTWGGVGWGC